eukprot:scaffold1482_cov120-Cylindrotheca_fusiformis.AAC.16
MSNPIDAFSQNSKDAKTIRTSVTQKSEKEPQYSESLQRRNFFGKSLGIISAIGTVVSNNPSSAAGADSPFGSISPSKRLGAYATLTCRRDLIIGVGRIAERFDAGAMVGLELLVGLDLVEQYPPQLRSYVPLLTTYTDSAFPSDLPSDWGLRVALRYEVGRFFGSLERFKGAVARKSLDEAYVAYSDMSLHLDRYLRVGGIYTYYDNVIDNEVLFKGYDDALVYSDPIKDPAAVRDLIVLAKGPDKGKTGIVIGVYQDGSETCAVKLDKYKGMREIRVVPRSWAAKRLGEQEPDEVFLIPRK